MGDRAGQDAPSAPTAGGAEGTRPGAWPALILATLSLAVGFTVWGLLAPLAPLFREQYGLSATQTGILVAVPVILGSVARIPLGLLTDRYGGRTVFAALMLFLVIPLALAGLTTSFALLMLASFFLGLAGAAFAVGVPFVARWFPPQRQGMALGVYGMGNIGTAVAALAAPALAGAFGWPFAFWGFLPVVVVMAALFWLFGRDAPGPRPVGSLATRLAPFRRPMAWVLSLFYFLTFGGFVAISVYLPTFLVDAYGLARTDAAGRAAGFVAVATIARPIGGVLADRWGGPLVLNGTFLAVALLAILLAFQPGMTSITVAFLGIAACFGLGNGAVFKLVPELFPNETGAVTGLVGAAGGLGGFFPPILMGVVRDLTGDYAIGFMLLSECALSCLIVNLLVLQRRGTALMPEPTAGPGPR
ncbi:MAG: NarK/NasA family nitrate transporter [Chloroflexi bacterium]|nr:NarK/NasA family nitrate transporter [Chloroflexota bacterium]